MPRSVVYCCLKWTVRAAIAGAWFVVFQEWVAYRPKYEIRTGIEQHPVGQFGSILEVEHVGNDGKFVVTVNRTFGPFIGIDHHGCWDSATGQQIEDQAKKDEGWQHIYEMAGANFYEHDLDHWSRLLLRWREKKRAAGLPKDGRRREAEQLERDDPFPNDSSLSSDGRFLVYPRDEIANVILEIPKGKGFDILVEDVDTGCTVATIRDEQVPLAVAPGGKHAAKFVPTFQDRPGARQLLMWSLANGELGTRTRLPNCLCRGVEFSTDGRFVLVRFEICPEAEPFGLIWCDTSGNRRGAVGYHEHAAQTDGGETLAVLRVEVGTGAADPQLKYIIDYFRLETGELIGTWVVAESTRLDYQPRTSASKDGRYFAMGYQPRPMPSFWERNRWLPRPSFLGGSNPRKDDEDQLLIVDTSRRRRIGCLSASSGTFSANNQWLATVNCSGVIHIWEMPPRKPLGRVLGDAAIATVVTWLGALAVARLFSRRKSRPPVKA